MKSSTATEGATMYRYHIESRTGSRVVAPPTYSEVLYFATQGAARRYVREILDEKRGMYSTSDLPLRVRRSPAV